MISIEQIENHIKQLENEIEKLPELRLGMLLTKVSYGSEKGNISRDVPLVIDNFHFTVNSHDTGNSVKVDIVLGDDSLNIINGTYWHSESTYGHNKFHRLNGAWDDALSKAVQKIRDKEETYLLLRLSEWENAREKAKKEEQDKVNKFASVFMEEC